ncbi:hypothetical protein JCM19314_3136 [Nonlabens ulvanivorans]|uniref:Deacylase n=1 Tax=Nonlabens ulvanivorans TaxID=906888 RepID=A0A090Q7Y7_NONUL|nr:acyloxyacyl hydrolase [Nonlabens ulvanivorans]GAK99105.1 hypothetical protein JCM19314_3136 [Nonlabens ulvanivorans]
MNNWIIVLVLFAFAKASLAQTNEPAVSSSFSIDASYYYGAVLQHNSDISHLITGHPEGVILRYNERTYGEKEWQSLYGFPDFGFTFSYQDLKNRSLGEAFGAYAHYNFYAFHRQLQYSIGTGIAYMTNPYDPVTNFRNVAYGTRFTSATYLQANYRKENLIGSIGFQTGITLIHYSNGNIKEPNTSTNSLLFNVGLNWSLEPENPIYKRWSIEKYKEPIHVNAILRYGWNESNLRGSGQFPFYTFSFYVDKRLNKKSSIHAGTELMLTDFLKEHRDYQANSFPNSGITSNESTTRVGLIAGHELHIGKTSVLTYLGVYLYDEINYGSVIYNRIGLQRRITNHWLTSLTLKSHGASAEALSIGLGYRL